MAGSCGHTKGSRPHRHLPERGRDVHHHRSGTGWSTGETTDALTVTAHNVVDGHER